jgi:cell division septal protein FtsQ
MRRRLALAGGAILVALFAAYLLLFRDSTVEPRLTVLLPAAVIGSGEGAVGVAPDGTVLTWQGPPPKGSLPSLPLSGPPKAGRLAGSALEQARVLGAAPAPLRPCIGSSYYGESGVDVKLRSGIELRFGNASRAAQKWRAAVTVLADPSITALDYVDLHSPGRPAYGGTGHSLPSASQEAAGGCG